MGVKNYLVPGVSERNNTPSIVVVNGRKRVPLYVSVNGAVTHHWYQQEEEWLIVGVCGRNNAPLLVSVKKIVPHRWCQFKK